MGSIKTIMFGRLRRRDTVRAGMVSLKGPIIHLLQMHWYPESQLADTAAMICFWPHPEELGAFFARRASRRMRPSARPLPFETPAAKPLPAPQGEVGESSTSA
jgi:hypothetical protein